MGRRERPFAVRRETRRSSATCYAHCEKWLNKPIQCRSNPVALDDIPAGPLDARQEARDELPAVLVEVKGLADLRRLGRGHRDPVPVEADGPGQAAVDGEVRIEPRPCPSVSDGNAAL